MTLKRSFAVILLSGCTLAVVAKAQTKPNFNVQRKAAPTPEVSSVAPREIENGKPTEIVLKGANFPAGDVKANASGACTLVKSAVVSPTEARFTVVSKDEEGGECSFGFSGNGRYVGSGVRVKPTAAAAARRQKEEDAQRAKQQAEAQAAMDYMKKAPEMVGKKWTVTLPGGKSDVWTFQEAASMGGQFKNSAGEKVMIMLMPGDQVMAQVGDSCIFSGKKTGQKAAGQATMPASMCKYGTGNWSATIQ